MGMTFKKASKQLCNDLKEALEDPAFARSFEEELSANGKAKFTNCNGESEITREMLSIQVFVLFH